MEYLWCNICLLLRQLILVLQFLGRSPLRTHGNSQLRPYWYDKMPPRLHLHDAHRYQGTELLGKLSAAPVYITLCH